MKYNDKEIINPVSVKNMVSVEVVEDIVDHIFKEISTRMGQKEMPKILIHRFGTFAPSKKKMDNRFVADFRKLENIEDPDKINWQSYKDKLESYFRIIKEKKVEPSEMALKVKEIVEKYEKQK